MTTFVVRIRTTKTQTNPIDVPKFEHQEVLAEEVVVLNIED